MSSPAIDVVNRWRAANFEREQVEHVLAPDVEWVVPVGGEVTTLRGIDAVLEWYRGPAGAEGAPGELDVSEERGELEDLGGGRVGARNRLVFRRRDSGEVAYTRSSRLAYTVRDGRIVRYELEHSPDEPGGE